jgi:hypothetical protein
MAEAVPVRAEVARDVKLDAARVVGGVGIDKAKADEAASMRKRAINARDLGDLARQNQQGVEAWRQANGETSIDRNIGSERNERGERILTTNPGVRARWERAIEANTLIKTLGEKGTTLDKISEIAQRDAVKSQMELFIFSSDDADYYRGLKPADQDAYINGILQDRQFINKLRTTYADHAKGTIQDPVQEALRGYQDAKLTLESAERKRNSAKSQLEGVKAAQRLYDKGGDSDARIKELAGSDARVKSLTSQLTLAQSTLSNLQNQSAFGRNRSDVFMGELNNRMGELTTQIADLNGFLATAESAAGELAILRDGGKGLSEKANIAEDKLQEAEDVLLRSRLENTRAKGDLDVAQGERNNLEEVYVKGWENLISKAATEWHADRLAEVEVAEKGHLEEMSRKSTDKLTQQLGKFLQSRYYRLAPEGRFNKTLRSEANKANLSADFKVMIDPRLGARSLAEQHVMAAGKAASLSAEEIRIHLENADYMSAQTNEVAKQVLGGYLRNGGKVNLKTWEYIESTDWGQEVADDLITNNPSVKEKEEQLKAAGILDKDGLRGYFTKNKGKGTGLLFSIIISVGAGLFR